MLTEGRERERQAQKANSKQRGEEEEEEARDTLRGQILIEMAVVQLIKHNNPIILEHISCTRIQVILIKLNK